MKRFMTGLLAIALTASLLAGCGQKGGAPEQSTASQTPTASASEASQASQASSSPSAQGGSETAQTTGAAASAGQTLMQSLEDSLNEQLQPLPKTNTGDKIGVLVYSLSNPFWANLKEKYEEAGRELGIDIEVMAVAKADDATAQLETLDAMLTKDYKAIIFSPMDGQNLIPGIVRANQAGIPVINLGPGVNQEELAKQGGKIDARITVNFEDQGKMVAEDMIKHLNKGDKVALIAGKAGAAQSEGRVKGAEAAFKAAGMDVVATLPGNWDRDTAYKQVTDLMVANPDVKAIFSANDVMGLAAVEALEQANLKDKVIVYGVDFTDEARQAITDGRYDGTITYSPTVYARAAELLTLKILQGETIEEPVYSPMIVVNQANIGDFADFK